MIKLEFLLSEPRVLSSGRKFKKFTEINLIITIVRFPGVMPQQEPDMKPDGRPNSLEVRNFELPPKPPDLAHSRGMASSALPPDKPLTNHIQPSVIKQPIVPNQTKPNPSLDVRPDARRNPSPVPRVAPAAAAAPQQQHQQRGPAAAGLAAGPAAQQSLHSPAAPAGLAPTLAQVSGPAQKQQYSEPTPRLNAVSDMRQPEPRAAAVSPKPSTIAPPTVVPPTPRPMEPPAAPQFPDPAVLRQPDTLQISEQAARGRTPTRQDRAKQQQQQQLPTQNDIQQAGGGYNFQKIMDDRFEHYKRPASRERSTDRFGLGSRQGSRQQLTRDLSRDRLGPQRPQSRQRTPMAGMEQQNFSEIKPEAGLSDSLNLDSATGNGMVGASFGGGGQFKLPDEDQIRYRGVQQEIPHFGAPPKRTESLYMKPGENPGASKVRINPINENNNLTRLRIIIC